MTNPLQSPPIGTRIAALVAVAGFVSAAWLAAGHESGKAILDSAAAMAPRPWYVTLPRVEIVGRREERAPATAFASNGTHAANEL